MADFSAAKARARSSNPFMAAVDRLNQIQSEKRAFDEKLSLEAANLDKMFKILARQHENAVNLQREKVRLQGVPIEGLKRQQGQLDESIGQQAQGIAQASGLAGIGEGGKIVDVDPETGEQVFVPENLQDTKNKLQIETLRRKLDPELISQEFQRELEQRRQKGEVDIQKAIKEQQEKDLRKAQVAMQSIDNMVDEVWKQAESLVPAQEKGRQAVLTGAGRAFAGTSLGRLATSSEMGESARAFEQFKNAIATPLIRELGEKGMLTNQDIERSKALLPRGDDTKQLRKIKRDAMNKFLSSKVRAHFELINAENEVIATQQLEKPIEQEEDFSQMSDEELQNIINQ